MDLEGCTRPVASGNSSRLVRFVEAMTRTVEDAKGDEALVLHHGTPHVAELIGTDDWLPPHLSVPISGSYGQYLLYRDPASRFTTVAFVWDVGSSTPIHDHMVWGIVGVLRGSEVEERFALRDGKLSSFGEARLSRGEIERVSPRIGDIHRVRNGRPDGPSISIHVYGADLCTVERHTYCPDTGRVDRIFSKPYDNGGAYLAAAG
jgi:predicted metal-dependent enzyme (double-stranded beta helix superfamily)